MRASDALRQSADNLICQETCNGLVTIFLETGGGNASAEPFHLRFVPRDADGLFNSWGTVMAGSYGDLESALAAAAEKYGAGEGGGWSPITAEDLPKGGHGPPPFDR
jgi:hypothetical protein